MARSGTPPPNSRKQSSRGGTNEKQPTNMTLFQRMGGINAVKAVVDEFYTRIQQDVRVQLFFVAISMAHLKRHQVEFLKIAFSHAPDGLDVHNLLLEKHKRLFTSMGLNETHFDIVANHFLDACCVHDVDQSLIDEAAAIVLPLRVVFATGAKTYGGKTKGPTSSPLLEQPVSPKRSSMRSSSPNKSPTRSPIRRIADAVDESAQEQQQ